MLSVWQSGDTAAAAAATGERTHVTRRRRLRRRRQRRPPACARSPAGRCHIKMSLPWKISPVKDNHGTGTFPPYKNIAGPIKSLPVIGSPPPRKVSPADNFPTKIRPARRPQGRSGFLPVNCRPEGDFFEERFYNGAPAYPLGPLPCHTIDRPTVWPSALRTPAGIRLLVRCRCSAAAAAAILLSVCDVSVTSVGMGRWLSWPTSISHRILSAGKNTDQRPRCDNGLRLRCRSPERLCVCRSLQFPELVYDLRFAVVPGVSS